MQVELQPKPALCMAPWSARHGCRQPPRDLGSPTTGASKHGLRAPQHTAVHGQRRTLASLRQRSNMRRRRSPLQGLPLSWDHSLGACVRAE